MLLILAIYLFMLLFYVLSYTYNILLHDTYVFMIDLKNNFKRLFALEHVFVLSTYSDLFIFDK
jgi:hypothetical protein